jgi:hypothetical protein
MLRSENLDIFNNKIKFKGLLYILIFLFLNEVADDMLCNLFIVLPLRRKIKLYIGEKSS